ncbi:MULTISPECIES: twin-arginine translocase TatA/TatE family subunit [Halobacterium]|uniref:twin-arginine translocase TatA/TatE family subunit n=1 Tax=Halobacterium TaxID=2239 RepID=UPI0019637C82|nr:MULTISPECIES: twin-arginine translocase TatA/TatE family subunit [Halobacterium]MCF2166318.1 twin-arginine translocase TatA/TatE family subunit [Halobacterium salinarum]MCF2168813.1 twin-arginine translocase TatA/TatE family subunit [Halobacterium salinarum]MCF2238487.1 twin-arginine translocase TatA/TatE family subunit [Halobacterium salinarum]QRY23308.1 twin-arginine translocase TatA/TatE family subunit [Halobacterium sp. GSL-19]WJK64559.1 twin-arginine translocase TatA/TatE family subuni
MFTSTPLFIGGFPGGMELAVVLLIAILLFGANKIPKLARSSGEAIGEFQKGREEVEQELQEIKSESAPDASADATADTTSDTTTDATSGADDTATN